jgi:hypothetical protein
MCLVALRCWAGLGSGYGFSLPMLYQYDDLTTLCIEILLCEYVGIYCACRHIKYILGVDIS